MTTNNDYLGYGILIGFAAAYTVLPLAYSAVTSLASTIGILWDRRRFPALQKAKRDAIVKGWEYALQWVAKSRPTEADVQRFSAMTLTQLQSALRSGEVTSTTLLRVFYITAKNAHEKTNCVVHVFTDAAISAAERADKTIAEARVSNRLDALPPLIGIPISIKDSTDVQGADSTCGLFGRCLKPAATDSTLVAQLRAAGAVFHVKTNIPALLMSYECDNGVFGACKNPVNQRYTCGGSSGGEGAIIKLGGSPAGMGSDVGGSIRIPAHFCGICGIKPSVNRVAYRGCQPEQGDEGVAPVSGPMGRCVDDLVTMLRILAAPVPHGTDGMQFNVPFQNDVFESFSSKKNLRIRYYREDGFIQLSPACRRGVDMAIAALKAQGHEVVEWESPITEEVMSVFFELFAADRCRGLQAELGSDHATGVIGPAIQLAQFPDRLKWLLGMVYSKKVDPVFGRLLSRLKERRIDEYFDLLMLRNRLRHRYAEFLKGFDCILAPGFTTPASLLGSTDELSYGAVNTAIYNALDLSIVTIPVTTVDKTRDVWHAEDIARAKNVGMTTAVAKDYDAVQMHGLPIGVQIITPRMTEEQALGISKQLERALAAKTTA